MKTSYYTFTTWDDGAMAAGFDGGLSEDRRADLARQGGGNARARGGDNVIDLNAWRAANPELLEEPEDGAEWTDGARAEPDIPAPRPRKSHRAMMTAELVSTACVAAAALALILRVLTF